MENGNIQVSRKKFAVWTFGILSAFTALRFLFHSATPPKTTTRMLTEDGKLVEVDMSKLPVKRRRIKDAEIHSWIRRKHS
jgi:hypothetical protein